MLTTGTKNEAHRVAAATNDADLEKAVELLVEQLNDDSSFETDADGQKQVVLNAEDVQARFLGLP